MDDPRKAGMTRAQHIWGGSEAWLKIQAPGRGPGESGLLPGSENGEKILKKMGMSIVQSVHSVIYGELG